MRYRLLHLILIIYCFVLEQKFFAQNLIPNAGFEYYSGCPTDAYHYTKLAIGWTTPSKEGPTPDFYHSCGEEDYQTPKNRYGNVVPYEGKGYAGLLNRSWWREYITIRLKEPLQPGKEYEASIYVQASDAFGSLIKNIGMYFSKKIPYQKRTKPITDPEITNPNNKYVEPQIKNNTKDYIPTEKWVKIKGIFTAKGNEKYVTIGCFSQKVDHKLVKYVPHISPENDPTLVLNESSNIGESYIYIDNINTTPIERPRYKLPIKGQIKKLNYVYFRFDKAELLPASYKELNLLLDILKRKKTTKIEVIGHTDSMGSTKHNLYLSEKRAKAVVDYLIKNGIDAERLSYKGMGSTNSKSDNITMKERQLNRRVEFRVID